MTYEIGMLKFFTACLEQKDDEVGKGYTHNGKSWMLGNAKVDELVRIPWEQFASMIYYCVTKQG